MADNKKSCRVITTRQDIVKLDYENIGYIEPMTK